MSKIKIMDELLANKIAAGEVVEKCASIVKELVENSIDANSKKIIVNLLDGGISKVEVIDDGDGMSKDDAILAFSRHATSKIFKDDDLFFIETLGFRGEALASIASVSEVDLYTSLGDIGTYVHLKGGKLLEVDDAEARKGTSIKITNLFYNTPARLKYLKSESSELNNCTLYIEKLALSHPNIAFVLTNNDRDVIRTSGSNNLLKTIHEIYGLTVSSNMLEIKNISDDFEIFGYVSKPSVLRKNRNHLITFINGRIVRNIELNKAINDAYNTYKHEGFFPIAIINIEVDPTMVDVNIHPTKQDVKLSKINKLTDLIYKTIKDELYNKLLIPNSLEENILENESNEGSTLETFNDNVSKEQMTFSFIDNKELTVKEKNSQFKRLELHPVGEVHGTYIIAENEDGMYIIDQHAAHERINYENTLRKMQQEKINIIEMLVPVNIELLSSEFNILMEHIDELVELGFDIVIFGINTVAIRKHPDWLIKGHEEENIRAIIDLIIANKGKFSKEKFLDSMAKTMSCKMSIKANDRMSFEEMEKLLDDLVKCDNPYNCCHGRPLIISFSNYDLEKMFKRVL